MEEYKSSVRPTLTYLFAVLIMVLATCREPIPDIVEYTWYAMMGVWFAERGAGRAGAAITKAIKGKPLNEQNH